MNLSKPQWCIRQLVRGDPPYRQMHGRLAHLGDKDVDRLRRKNIVNIVDGLPATFRVMPAGHSETCDLCKIHMQPFLDSRSTTSAAAPGYHGAPACHSGGLRIRSHHH